MPGRWRWWAPAGLLALFGGLAAWSVAVHSGAADELGAHIPAGFLYWRSGRWSGGLGNFPLGGLLIAAPAALFGGDYSLWSEAHLALFRLPVVLLGLATVAMTGWLGRRLGGPLAGLAAMALAATSPNLLAHGSLATLDLPVTAFILAVICGAEWASSRQADGARGVLPVLLTSLALGAALLTKVQALLLLPLLPLMLGMSGRLRRRSAWVWSLALLVPWLLAHLVYLRWPLAGGALLPPGWTEALGEKWRHAGRGHFTYLLGQYGQGGDWRYFPVAMGLKTPLPTLALLLLGLARRPSRDEALFAWLPAGALLGLAMVSHVQIGLRHVLPAYPLLFVIAGIGAARLRVRWLGPGLVALSALTTLWRAPHFLAFFNLLAGGPAGGHRYLVQSNYDWGLHDGQARDFIEKSDEHWQIDPDPQTPGAGHVLINANARYGIINGGAEAYGWLEDTQPVDRVAWTWFVYDVPGVPRSAPDAGARAIVRRHLAELVEQGADLRDGRLHRRVASVLKAAGAYDSALDELRLALRIDPTDAHALASGGELVVRHKLGVLRFDEEAGERLPAYLRPLRVHRGAPLEVSAVVQAARTAKLTASLAKVWGALGIALHDVRDDQGAAEAWRWTLRFRPTDAKTMQRLVWTLATSRDEAVRDGAEALRWVERLGGQRGWDDSSVEDLLAAALAEEGEYARAEEQARAAAQQARAGGDGRKAARIEERAEVYASGRAWRQ